MVKVTGANDNKGTLVTQKDSPYVKNSGLKYTTARYDGSERYSDYNYYTASGDANNNGSTGSISTVEKLEDRDATGATALINKVVTIQEINKSNVTDNIAADATNALKAAKLDPAITLNKNEGLNTKGNLGDVTALSSSSALSGLVVYNSAQTMSVGNADGKKLGYKVPVYGVEENVYDANGKVLNAIGVYNAAGDAVETNNEKYAAYELVSVMEKDTTPGSSKVAYGEFYKSDATYEYDASGAKVNSGELSNANKYGKTVANNLETRVFGGHLYHHHF